MSPASFRSAFLGALLFLGTGLCSEGGMTSYTDPGKTDFDTVMQVLNPYGTWSKMDGSWAYTPLDHLAPYTHGRWIYTEFGWCWKGDLPHSWVTEHYGYWKRGADGVWSWYPGPYWLPEIVEIRTTATHIGWRSAAVDREGNFIEQPADRYAKTDEWTFVSMAQFAGPITPEIVVKPEETKGYLEDSTECRHVYVTYREIDRPGPHPADFVALCKDGGMFAPTTLQDQLAAQVTPTPKPVLAPGVTLPTLATPTNATGAPVQAPPANRKVNYWVTMSLPTFWTPRPPEAQPKEIYLYRPDFYQDDDGIARRITLWLDPKSRKSSGQSLSEILGGHRAPVNPDTNAASSQPASPAVPVTPPAPAKQSNAFRSPFDDSFHGGGNHAATKTPGPTPPGTNATDGPVPPPTVDTTQKN